MIEDTNANHSGIKNCVNDSSFNSFPVSPFLIVSTFVVLMTIFYLILLLRTNLSKRKGNRDLIFPLPVSCTSSSRLFRCSTFPTLCAISNIRVYAMLRFFFLFLPAQLPWEPCFPASLMAIFFTFVINFLSLHQNTLLVHNLFSDH